MKSLMYLFVGFSFTLVCMLSACKSKQSAYQKVYEAAKARSTVQMEATVPIPSDKRSVVIKKSDSVNNNFQVERIKKVDGFKIKQYNIVIGSFINKANAESLKNSMQNRGYRPVLVQNEKGLYRVIVSTFDNKVDACTERNTLRDCYPKEFEDAWLLKCIIIEN